MQALKQGAALGLTEIIFIAIALSMDALAVSITLGLSVRKLKIIEYFIPGIYFGLFQAIMPLIGHSIGVLFAERVLNIGPWLVFVLFCFIGGKMIKGSFSKEEEKNVEKPFHFAKMLLLATATSIDALTVGVTFAFFEMNILLTITIIGLATFFLSIGGVKIGNIFGIKFKSRAEFIGGAVLILLGIRILIEHL